MTNIDLKKSWDNISLKYQNSVDISTEDVHYGPCGLGENYYNLIGEVSNKRILELGCGGGQNSIFLASRGANVTGVDFSKNQIAYAKKLAEANNLKIDFVASRVERIDEIFNREFDVILSSFLIEYISDIFDFFKKMNSVLSKNGNLILCDLHPFSSAGQITKDKVNTFFDTIDYFNQRKIEFNWKFENESKNIKFYRYHRTLETYINTLLKAGFELKGFFEPEIEFNKDSQSQPYRDNSILENKIFWMKMPYSFIIKAQKNEL
ncbi:class I SAM-dependent methyltransferase [Gracilimonas sp.]|uniref:class I SAM-dependent methyltransferase n=1 Tax=Gracilimonas sp. TaxID=1974203 RepID=UPI0032EB8F4D